MPWVIIEYLIEYFGVEMEILNRIVQSASYKLLFNYYSFNSLKLCYGSTILQETNFQRQS